jgi:hypothetical protein
VQLLLGTASTARSARVACRLKQHWLLPHAVLESFPTAKQQQNPDSCFTLITFQGRPPAHSASASYVGLPVAAAARMSMQLVASFAHATSSIVSTPTSTPVLDIANGIGRMELQQRVNDSKQWQVDITVS